MAFGAVMSPAESSTFLSESDICGSELSRLGVSVCVMYGCGQTGALTGCGKRLLLLIRRNGLQHRVRLQFVSNGLGNQSIQPINGCILSVLALLLHLPHYSHYSAACGLSNALPMAYGLAGD